MDSQDFAKVFPFGSHLCREPMPPMSEQKRDMENLQRHGFNLVKLQEHWMIDEPAEGQFDFSRYEELIEYAARLDMGVYLGLTCEQAPLWLYKKHPGCRMVGYDGIPLAYVAQTTLPADGKPGPCFDHPGAMADQVRFIKKLVETLGRFENLVVWNTWQEIAYWSERLVGQQVCYCENTLSHYRRWLQEKYVDLDTLNREWNARYAVWEDIVPDRCHMSQPEIQEFAFRYFMDNVQIAAVLRARAAAIREADPLKRPVFAHEGLPVIGAGQHWTYARTQDYLGASGYPAWCDIHGWDDAHPEPGETLNKDTALLQEMWDGIAIKYDTIRSASKPGAPIWAAEFQGGPIVTGFQKGRVPTAEDIRRWMLTAVGAGITGLSFWLPRAEIMASEVNGFSLLDSAGDTTPRFEEASRVGRALQRHADLFGVASRPQAGVAIIVNEWNFQLCSRLPGGEHLAYSLRGWYRLLWEMGIAVDFLEVSQLDESRVRDYKALILPFPMSLSEQVAEDLARYVEAGGSLISEACPGRINENGFCSRGELSPRMAELFGVRHASYTMVREPDGGRRWWPEDRFWGEYIKATMLNGVGLLAGHGLRANVYLETFALDDAQPILLHEDAPAGVARNVGKGAAYLIGTFAGHSGTAYRDQRTFAAIAKLLETCGITPEHDGKLLIQKRVVEGKQAWVLTNPTDHDVTEQIDVSGFTDVTDLLDGPFELDGDTVTLTVTGFDVRVLIGS